jgi:hypothetical protein
METSQAGRTTGPKGRAVRVVIAPGLLCAAFAALALGVAGCQGSVGSPGLPQPPGNYAPAAPAAGAPAATPYSRTRTLEGAVYLVPDEAEVPLPAVGGFGVAIELSSPAPGMAPSLAPTAGSRTVTVVRSAAPAASLAAGAASALPSGGFTPAPGTSPASAVSSPGASGAPVAGPTAAPNAASPAPGSSAHPVRHPSPAPSGPKIDTKTTIYPTDAPVAPSPIATGNVQTFMRHTAIVRGYVMSAADLALNSLDSVRFTIPKEEQTPNRGFEIAIYDLSKKKKPHLVAFSSDTSLSSGVISSSGETDPIKLSKGTAYALVLYGDELPPTPPPPPPTTIPPANNPFATPVPAGPPGYAPPGYPQPTYPPGYPTPTPITIGPH